MNPSPINERERFREAGNEFFKKGDFLNALRCWQDSLSLFSDQEQAQSVPILNNCSLASLRLARWESACDWALKAVAATNTTTFVDVAHTTKANYRCALAHLSRGMYEEATKYARVAAQLSPTDRLVTLIAQALNAMTPTNGCRSLPRLKPIEATGFAELFAIGQDRLVHVFQPIQQPILIDPALGEKRDELAPVAPDYFKGVKCLPITLFAPDIRVKPGGSMQPESQDVFQVESMSAYLGGVGDGRHVLATMMAFAMEHKSMLRHGVHKVPPGTKVNLYLNDLSTDSLVRLIVLLILLERASQRDDIETAVKSPQSESVATRSAIFAYASVWASSLVPEFVYNSVLEILQLLGGEGDFHSVLPSWLKILPESRSALRKHAAKLARTASTFTTAQVLRAIEEGEQITAESNAALIREAKDQISSLPAGMEPHHLVELLQQGPLAGDLQLLPQCRDDITRTYKTRALPFPPGVPESPLYPNPTFISLNALQFDTPQMWRTSPTVFIAAHEFMYTQHDVRAEKCLYNAAAHTIGVAAFGLAQLRSSGVALEAEIRLGELTLDLDRLALDGVRVDRVTTSNVADYVGALNILVSGSRILRNAASSCVTFEVLMASTLWKNTAHFVWEYSRLHLHELAYVFDLEYKSGSVWASGHGIAFGRPFSTPTPLSEDTLYGWLASLFVLIARPATPPPNQDVLHVYMPAAQTLWLRCLGIVAERRPEVAHRVLVDILKNKLTSPEGYPTALPGPPPADTTRPPRDKWLQVNVAPHLSELRALLCTWPWPMHANNDQELELLAAGWNRASLAVKLEVKFAEPPRCRKGGIVTDEPLHSPCVSLALFTGANALALLDSWPAPLLNNSPNLHIFSVLEWDSSAHKAAFWMSFDDLQAAQQQGGFLRPFRTDTRKWLRREISLLEVKISG